MPLLRRLARTFVRDFVDEPDAIFGEPEVRSVLVMARTDDPFYYNMTDEDFCEWARSWAPSPVVLTPDDRDAIMDRIRSTSGSWGYMEV